MYLYPPVYLSIIYIYVHGIHIWIYTYLSECIDMSLSSSCLLLPPCCLLSRPVCRPVAKEKINFNGLFLYVVGFYVCGGYTRRELGWWRRSKEAVIDTQIHISLSLSVHDDEEKPRNAFFSRGIGCGVGQIHARYLNLYSTCSMIFLSFFFLLVKTSHPSSSLYSME